MPVEDDNGPWLARNLQENRTARVRDQEKHTDVNSNTAAGGKVKDADRTGGRDLEDVVQAAEEERMLGMETKTSDLTLPVFERRGPKLDMAPGHTCLLLLDQIISGLIIAPLTIGYWRGTWTLLNIAFTDNPTLGGWVSVLIGNIGMCMAAFLQHVLKSKVRKSNKLSWLFGYHIYSYVVAFINLNLWRGIWETLNVYTGTGPLSYAVSLAFGYGFLIFMRASQNCVAPPMVVWMDTEDSSFFDCGTRFKVKPKENVENYILDTLFTYLVIHNCVVLYWRGLWGLLDNFLYPDDTEMSIWLCLGIAYFLVLILFPGQLIADLLYKRCNSRNTTCSWTGKVLIQMLLYLFANACAVLLWRGVWYACDVYLWPEHQVESSWLTHGVGIGTLMLLGCGNSTIVKGCGLDGEGDGSGGCLAGNDYLRYWFLGAGAEKGDIDISIDHNGNANKETYTSKM